MGKGNSRATRIIFERDNVLYKICGFSAGKDGSFYLMNYTQEKNLYVLNQEKIVRKKYEYPDVLVEDFTINFADFEKIDFQCNKTSFHPTGLVHTTDYGGKRDCSDIKSTPFGEIKDYKLLALVLPADISKFQEIGRRDLRNHDVVINSSVFGNWPFQIDLYLVRGKKEKIYPPKPQSSKIIEIFCGEDETFCLHVRLHQQDALATSPFPPHTLIIYEVIPKGI